MIVKLSEKGRELLGTSVLTMRKIDTVILQSCEQPTHVYEIFRNVVTQRQTAIPVETVCARVSTMAMQGLLIVDQGNKQQPKKRRRGG